MGYEALRHDMVVRQLERRGIHDSRVLEAMDWVPREKFVPDELRTSAYDDCALPIGHEQTISQPFTVAYMCQEARILPDDKVLEIGTGSGYGAAVLALLAREVHTLERIEPLHDAARHRLERLSRRNVHAHLSDGTLGLADEAPFDAIVVTAGAEDVPEALRRQLSEGGRLVMPVGPAANQQMVRLIRHGDHWEEDHLGSFGFVPLVSEENGV